MVILVATICLLADPLTVDCRTDVLRVEPDAATCAAMVTPTIDLIKGQASALPVVYLVVGCKAGDLG